MWSTYDIAVASTAVVTMVALAHQVKISVSNGESKLPPRVWGLPYLGSMYGFFKDPYKFLSQCKHKYGNVFRFQLRGADIITVLDDDALVSEFYKGGDKKLDLLGSLRLFGLDIIVGVDLEPTPQIMAMIHEMAKRRMTPLRQKIFPQYPKLCDILEPHLKLVISERLPGNSGTFTTKDTLRRIVYRMSTVVLLGEDLCENETLYKTMFEIIDSSDKLMAKWTFRGERERFMKLHAIIDNVLRPVIHKRQNLKAASPETWLEDNGLSDYLSFYIHMNSIESFQQIGLDEAMTTMQTGRAGSGFLFSALVNTAQAVENFLVRILAHPAVHKALIEELENACQSLPEGKLNDNVLKELSFLDACFWENARLGAGRISLRQVLQQPVKLPNGYEAPVGSYLAVSPIMRAMDPTVFPEPETFNPWRMLGKEGENLRSESGMHFLSFGAGRHVCPGRPMAVTEGKLIAAELIRLYELEALRGADGKIMPDLNHVVFSFHHFSRDVKIQYKLRDAPLGSTTN